MAGHHPGPRERLLDPRDRTRLDAELGPRLPMLGDRQVEAQARAIAYRLDPHAFTTRGHQATADRQVSLRPAPDTMSRLSAFLPAAQGVAAHAALARHAQTLRARGDARSRGQIMADTLVERVTGQATAHAGPVEVNLIIPDTALFGDRPQPADAHEYDDRPDELGADWCDDVDRTGGRAEDEPAYLLGYGPIPAPAARELIERAEARVWLRRLFTRPETGRLVAMESRRRVFPSGLRRFLILRDQRCRTPWCGAPIRHADHVVPAEAGGATSEADGQGLCEACNYTKQAPGWRAEPGPGGAGESVAITTPTGHSYASRPPPPPGSPPAPPGSLPPRREADPIAVARLRRLRAPTRRAA